MTNRLRVIAALMMDDPEEVEGVKMIGLIFQYLPIHLLRFRQTTGLMKNQRPVECRPRLGPPRRRRVSRRVLWLIPGPPRAVLGTKR